MAVFKEDVVLHPPDRRPHFAKHYGVSVIACPPHRGNRKGTVEKSIYFATQRRWPTKP